MRGRETEGERGDGTETKEMIPKKDVSCICEVGSYWAEIGVQNGMFEVEENREFGRSCLSERHRQALLRYFHEQHRQQRLLKQSRLKDAQTDRQTDRRTDVVRHE